MQEITIAVNNMRAKGVHFGDGSSCDCHCPSLCCKPMEGDFIRGLVACQTSMHTYKRATQFWEKSLCPRLEGSSWHDLKCLKGLCKNCGFQMIPLCIRELDPGNQATMTWRRFEKVLAGKTRIGERKHVLRLEHKTSNPRMFLAWAAPKIRHFVYHQHQAKWQEAAYKNSLNLLQPGEVLSLIDFAENYSFKGQDEVQSQHWFNFQLTILVHITYTVNLDYNPLDPLNKRLKVDYFYYISDDRKHDSLFVQKCLTDHWNYLKLTGAYPSRHIVWSDGCAAQFKGSKAWFYVSR
jgi:hypothetical protein